MNTQPLAANSLTGRTHYHSSGAIHLGPFLWWTLLALGVTGLLAAGMFWLYTVGYYIVVLVPVVCAFAVAGMARLAIARGHCRNWFVGSLMGFCLGVSLYLGSYYIGMIYTFGPQTATRADAFILYVRLRLATDVVRDVGAPKKTPEQADSSTPGMNWFRFALESIAVLAIVTAAAGRRARKPYCEHCHRWLVRETTPFEPEKGAGLVQSLQTGSPRALAGLCAGAPYTTVPNLTLAVEYCPSLKEGTARDCPVYVSLKQITANLQGAALDTFEQSKGKVIERAVQLNPDELPALAPRFPVFEAYAGRAAVASLLPTSEPEERQEETKPEGAFAEITPLGSEHCGKVLTRKRMWQNAAFGFSGLVGIIGGAALLAWGAGMLEGSGAGPTARAASIGLCVTGGVFVLVAFAGVFFDTSFGGNRRLRKAFRLELARRSGVLVEPDHPDALFIEVVPKLNWGKMMLDNASDVGLLLVDQGRHEIRFEGDKERWRVPAASITSCEMETYVQGQGAGATKIYYTVLRAARPDEFWEAPLRERGGFGVLQSSKRKNRAARLAAAIQALRESTPVRA